MSRGEISTWLLLLIVAVAAGIGFAYIILPKILELSHDESMGCPLDVPIKSVCPCGDARISSGFCCEDGPSLVPCYCAKINKCSDYTTRQRELNECKIQC